MNGNSSKTMSKPIGSTETNEQDIKLDPMNDKNVANGACDNSINSENHVKEIALDIQNLITSKCEQDMSQNEETENEIEVSGNNANVENDMSSEMQNNHIGDDSPKEREPFQMLSSSSIKSLNTLQLEHDVDNTNDNFLEDSKGNTNSSDSSNIPKQGNSLNGLKSSCNSDADPSDHDEDSVENTNSSGDTELGCLQKVKNALEEDEHKIESFKIVTIERHHSDGEDSPDFSNSDHFATSEDLLDNGVVNKSDDVIILESHETDNLNKAPEIHEIRSDNSDNDDCVVTAVEKVSKKKVATKRKAPNNTDVTPRRSSRTTKRIKYDEVVEQVDDESDVEEVVLEDPLRNMIQDSSVNNTSKQLKCKTSLKKAPSILVNNSLMQSKSPAMNKTGNVLNKHIGPLLKPRGTTVTSVTVKTTVTQATQVNMTAPLLPTLTDDMFVIETPSFIVPYLYEKPSAVPFKEFVGKWGKEIEEAKAKEEKELMENNKQEKAKREKEKQERRDRGEIVIDSDEEMNTEEMLKKIAEKAARKEKRRRQREDDDVSWDGSSGEETDDDDSEEEGQLTVKDKSEIIQEVKDAGITVKPTTKSESYFDLCLGKIFMNIGSNLVQEYVQTDLLNEENRKLRREKKAGHTTKERQVSIALLTKNLKLTQKANELFKFEQKKCKLCTFKTESALAMAHHLETPHMKNNLYRCNYCSFETRSPHDILLHMEKEHGVKGKLERAPAQHQCTRCPFEDHGKAKMTRHLVTCAKRFKPETNLAPPLEWEHPAKIAKITIGRNNAANFGRHHVDGAPTTNVCIPIAPGMPSTFRMRAPLPPTRAAPTTAILRHPVPQPAHSIANIRKQMTPSAPTMTPPPRQNSPMQLLNAVNTKGFVLCEICDGFIRNLEQLRNHMHRIHKVKIHSKMIYNRPPLNCQKCQFRFFTDQGLERHLLGTHGLVTRAIQEAANKGKDAGRCPVCGKVCQWKLLSHVSREHNLVLKPAHLSYKCTVCTATFGMYRQFESHVYSAHSVIAKKAIDKKVSAATSKNEANDNAAKLLQTNNEITITPRSEKANASAKQK